MGASPGTKRGLVARFCPHVQLFAPRARQWQYNHGTSLAQFDMSWTADAKCRAIAGTRGYYVPMVFSLEELVHHTSELHSRRALVLLGQNEPSDAKNQSAHAVAARWKEMEAIADRHVPPLMLGSPSPGGLELRKSERWLREFVAACHNCRIDFLAVHWYECDGRTAASAAASARAMMQWLESIHRQFPNKPLWLTEFNCGDGAAPQPLANQSAQSHLRFMRAVLPLLEATSYVHRYAWFQTWQRHTPTRPGKNPGCSLVTPDGASKTALGHFYSTFELSGGVQPSRVSPSNHGHDSKQHVRHRPNSSHATVQLGSRAV